MLTKFSLSGKGWVDFGGDEVYKNVVGAGIPAHNITSTWNSTDNKGTILVSTCYISCRLEFRECSASDMLSIQKQFMTANTPASEIECKSIYNEMLEIEKLGLNLRYWGINAEVE